MNKGEEMDKEGRASPAAPDRATRASTEPFGLGPDGRVSTDAGDNVIGATAHEREYPLYCSFCGKSQHQVVVLIAGPTVFICDECVDLCASLAAEHRVRKFIREELKAMRHD